MTVSFKCIFNKVGFKKPLFNHDHESSHALNTEFCTLSLSLNLKTGIWKVQTITGIFEADSNESSPPGRRSKTPASPTKDPQTKDSNKGSKIPKGKNKRPDSKQESTKDSGSRPESKKESSPRPGSKAGGASDQDDQKDKAEEGEEKLGPPGPATGQLVLVIYGEGGKTEELLLQSDVEEKFLPGQVDDFEVSDNSAVDKTASIL